MVTAKQRAARAKFVARFARGGKSKHMPRSKSSKGSTGSRVRKGIETVGVDNVAAGAGALSALNCPSSDGQSLVQVWKSGGGMSGVASRFRAAWLTKGAAWSANPYWAPAHDSGLFAVGAKAVGVAARALVPRLARAGFRLGKFRVRLAKG